MLIEKRLQNGVVIAVRDTPRDENNPYTFTEIKRRFKKMFGDKVKVIKIPDIGEVCYGRDVGYKITRLRLKKKYEEISATKIRKKLK